MHTEDWRDEAGRDNEPRICSRSATASIDVGGFPPPVARAFEPDAFAAGTSVASSSVKPAPLRIWVMVAATVFLWRALGRVSPMV